MHTLLLLAHTCLCVALAWSAGCRLIKMNVRDTFFSIRLAFTSVAMTNIVLTIAPWGFCLWPTWFPPYEPHLSVVLMLGGFFFVQYATSRHWRKGVPKSFCKECT